ncbi:hypothetical protein PM082_015519 [Marasmius tenuissimus]|nr:hypothetical protein PM082_015519 [Marasmius tenuissimus]
MVTNPSPLATNREYDFVSNGGLGRQMCLPVPILHSTDVMVSTRKVTSDPLLDCSSGVVASSSMRNIHSSFPVGSIVPARNLNFNPKPTPVEEESPVEEQTTSAGSKPPHKGDHDHNQEPHTLHDTKDQLNSRQSDRGNASRPSLARNPSNRFRNTYPAGVSRTNSLTDTDTDRIFAMMHARAKLEVTYEFGDSSGAAAAMVTGAGVGAVGAGASVGVGAIDIPTGTGVGVGVGVAVTSGAQTVYGELCC